ncbi:uncharacterized protein LOC125076798 [Vanessa atalanta]|uniref:uncharacterized protein LOC125076798 n=1 Tax=Vanessa atalanta TaxID=42275 RepID=UPI001FCD61F4|nr:uncharacterized protein LOC125076798 [Vanessa atalanta]
MGEGIIIFALWYIVIAYNYLIENCASIEKNSDAQSKSSQIPDFIIKSLSVLEADVKEDDIPITEEIVTLDVTKEPDKLAETVEPAIDNNEDTSVDEFIHEEIDEE